MTPGSPEYTCFSVCREDSWVSSGRDPLPSWKESYPFLVDVCLWGCQGKVRAYLTNILRLFRLQSTRGANGLRWNEDICLISLMSKRSTPQSLARSVPAHTQNWFWNGSLLQCSSPAHAWGPGHSRNPAYLDLQQGKASKSHAASPLSASRDQQGLSEVNKWPVS